MSTFIVGLCPVKIVFFFFLQELFDNTEHLYDFFNYYGDTEIPMS